MPVKKITKKDSHMGAQGGGVFFASGPFLDFQ